MSDILYLISEEGLPTFLVVTFLIGIGFIARWIATYFIARIDSQFAELLREIAVIKAEVMDNNNKLYNITETLIKNSRKTGENIKAIESSLDTLLKFLNKNGR